MAHALGVALGRLRASLQRARPRAAPGCRVLAGCDALALALPAPAPALALPAVEPEPEAVGAGEPEAGSLPAAEGEALGVGVALPVHTRPNWYV